MFLRRELLPNLKLYVGTFAQKGLRCILKGFLEILLVMIRSLTYLLPLPPKSFLVGVAIPDPETLPEFAAKLGVKGSYEELCKTAVSATLSSLNCHSMPDLEL